MEQFLRNYFTNLNPNATEEEILAFLQSQGFGVGNQTVTGGIMNTPNIIQDSGGDGISTRIKGTGTGSISDLFNYIKSGGIIGTAARGVANLFQNFANKRAGRLDITADAGIMPTGREIGSLTTADDYGYGADGGGRSMDEQSFSDSQSYGGGGSDDDMGADSFI
jgi:hypothetical protein|tara:strand:- start:1554 stop:2048 length:495 start_codon:yes stop_codon:yes gene_type:complete